MEKIVEFVNTLQSKNLDMVVGSRTGKNVNYSKLRSIPKWFLKMDILDCQRGCSRHKFWIKNF